MCIPMRFWGTSAGGTIPAPFCKCPVCENARIKGGKEVRLRSAFRIDSKIMIDIGEDYAVQAMRLGEDLSEVEHFLITHTHKDHFNTTMFWLRSVASAMPPQNTINVYLTDEAFFYVEKFMGDTPTYKKENEIYYENQSVRFKKLTFYEKYQINDIQVIPLKGAHGTVNEKNSANFLIKLKDGKTMYYALDSGYYLEETFDYLKGTHLDILVGECTFPAVDSKDACPVHMDITSCVKTLDRLCLNKTIDEKTEVYLSHIEAKGMNHEQLQEYFERLGKDYSVKIAYDGLSIK